MTTNLWRQWVSPTRARRISAALRCLAPFDAHADRSGEYRVHAAAILPAFTLKRYNDNATYIKLERRLEQGGKLARETTAVTPEDAKRLLRGEIGWIDDAASPLLRCLREDAEAEWVFGMDADAAPVVTSCAREAFEYRIGDVRVTLDRGIVRCADTERFFAPDSSLSAPAEGVLLTVRYAAFLPQVIGDIVIAPDARPLETPRGAAAWAF